MKSTYQDLFFNRLDIKLMVSAALTIGILLAVVFFYISESRNEGKDIFFLAAFTIGSVEFLLFILTKKFVSNPLARLEAGMSEISNGNLNYRVDIKSSCEIEGLGRHFNKMASDLDKSMKQMETSYEWFQNILINSYDGINISVGGTTAYVNPAYMLLFGYGELELIGKPFEIVFSDESKEELHRNLQSFDSDANVFRRVDAVGITKDQNPIFLDISFSAMDIKDERYVIAILKDNTEKKLAEGTRLKNAELLRSNELKDMFTDIMRHDLLNPIGVISGYSEILLDMEVDETKKRYLANINNNTKTLVEMIEYASLLAKLESVDKVEYEELDIGRTLKTTIGNLALQLKKREVVFGFELEGGYYARAHPMIESVFQNLISNAVKYSPENSRIEVNIIEDDGFWRVDVVDEGEGISDEDKPYVFDRFKRVNKGNIKGTGLGLAIVRKIVELHSGKVSVSDNPAGRGCVFSIWVSKAPDKNI